MSTTNPKKIFSDEDDDSDDMGTNKIQSKPTKKRKRNTIKRFDDEQHATTTNTAASKGKERVCACTCVREGKGCKKAIQARVYLIYLDN